MLEEVARSGSFEVHPVAKETSHANLFVKTKVNVYEKKKREKAKKDTEKGKGKKQINYGFPTYKLSLFATVRIENYLPS